MSDLRLGVIGLGLRRSIATSAHHPGKGSAITAVCDLDPEVRRREAERFGAEIAVEDYKLLLGRDDLDAIIVATPDDTHEVIAIDALRAGKAVFVEKPLGITVESCDNILRAAYETGSRLYVGHNMRHMGVVRLMRDIIARGDIGEPKAVWVRHFVGYGGDYYFKDWHADRTRTTGLLLQKAAHDIDVLHWLAAATPAASTPSATCSSTGICRAASPTPPRAPPRTGCASSTGRRRPARTCTTSWTSRTSR